MNDTTDTQRAAVDRLLRQQNLARLAYAVKNARSYIAVALEAAQATTPERSYLHVSREKIEYAAQNLARDIDSFKREA